jgi:23S rRNA pseudouridine1911/1915/1917 synthase
VGNILTVDLASAGTRLDRWLAAHLPDLSRARVQALIDDEHVLVDGAVKRAAHRLRGGEVIDVEIPPRPADDLAPEPMDLSIVYEDEHLIVIDKPAGMVVHPGAGNARGTLAAAVLAHAPAVASVGGARRPGIVHRLDKGTSGLLVLAKTPVAYDRLVAQLAARTVKRRYIAVAHGRMAQASGIVDAPIGRHPHDRVRMAIRPTGSGKRAITRFRVLERLGSFTYVELTLETGRTHQIRVHLASLGHPIVGDETYGRNARGTLPVRLDGHALHAVELRFLHPVTQEPQEFTAPVPSRIERLLSHLRRG